MSKKTYINLRALLKTGRNDLADERTLIVHS